jgi:hypothetical protein
MFEKFFVSGKMEKGQKMTEIKINEGPTREAIKEARRLLDNSEEAIIFLKKIGCNSEEEIDFGKQLLQTMWTEKFGYEKTSLSLDVQRRIQQSILSTLLKHDER